MAINKATLAKEVDGKIEYIYPKTTADLVEYDSSQTVEQKIQSIDQDVETVDNRITTIATGVASGGISTSSDAELFDIRNPNTDVVGTEVTYASAGEAVRAQIGALSDEIENTVGDLYSGVYYEPLYVNNEILTLEDGTTPIMIKTTISDLAADGFERLKDQIKQLVIDTRDATIRLCNEYAVKKIHEIILHNTLTLDIEDTLDEEDAIVE